MPRRLPLAFSKLVLTVSPNVAVPLPLYQVQGNIEHFRDSCGGVIGWLDSVTYYTAFTEGWALYAENPLIAEDTDAYKYEPMQKFGMLKWQVRRKCATLGCCLLIFHLLKKGYSYPETFCKPVTI